MTNSTKSSPYLGQASYVERELRRLHKIREEVTPDMAIPANMQLWLEDTIADLTRDAPVTITYGELIKLAMAAYRKGRADLLGEQMLNGRDSVTHAPENPGMLNGRGVNDVPGGIS